MNRQIIDKVTKQQAELILDGLERCWIAFRFEVKLLPETSWWSIEILDDATEDTKDLMKYFAQGYLSALKAHCSM